MAPAQRLPRSLPPVAPVVAVLAVVVSLLGVLWAGPATGADGAGTLVVRARGNTGREIMEVRVGGAVAGRFTVTTGWAEYRASTRSATEAAAVEVAFVNDSMLNGDNNLYVDWVAFAGRLHQAEDPAVVGTGVWEHGARCHPGNHRSEELACYGAFTFGDLPWDGLPPTDPTVPDPVAGSVITVRAAGSTGSEVLEVNIDGVPVAAYDLDPSSDLFDDPAYDDYVYRHDGPVDPDRVSLDFVDDVLGDTVERRVRLASVDVDGTVMGPEQWAIDPGHLLGPSCRPWRAGNEVLVCSSNPALDPTTTTTPAPTTTAPSTTVPTVPSTSTTGPGAATGRFYVVGTDIVDPDGRVFYPVGANVAIKFTPYGYVFEGNNGGVNDHVDDIGAWNWNTVRATLICDNDSGVPTMAELIDGIAPTIEQLTAAGIVVILECHDATGSDLVLGSAKDLRVRQFWDTMAARYRDNPYVWFNIYNEPYAGGDTSDWARLHQFYIDRIRATGAENIIVADLPVWGQGIDLVGADDFADGVSASCNTVLGWHAYGAIAGRQGSVADHEAAIRAAQAKGMALLVGEYGVALPADWGNAGPWQWNVSGFEAMSDLGPRYGIGLLWWHATGDQAYFSLYALKADRSGFWSAGNGGNLSPYGQAFWDTSHAVPADLGPFTGDLADSGCPSAG